MKWLIALRNAFTKVGPRVRAFGTKAKPFLAKSWKVAKSPPVVAGVISGSAGVAGAVLASNRIVNQFDTVISDATAVAQSQGRSTVTAAGANIANDPRSIAMAVNTHAFRKLRSALGNVSPTTMTGDHYRDYTNIIAVCKSFAQWLQSLPNDNTSEAAKIIAQYYTGLSIVNLTTEETGDSGALVRTFMKLSDDGITEQMTQDGLEKALSLDLDGAPLKAL